MGLFVPNMCYLFRLVSYYMLWPGSFVLNVEAGLRDFAPACAGRQGRAGGCRGPAWLAHACDVGCADREALAQERTTAVRHVPLCRALVHRLRFHTVASSQSWLQPRPGTPTRAGVPLHAGWSHAGVGSHACAVRAPSSSAMLQVLCMPQASRSARPPR